MATTVPANADLMAIVVIGVSSSPLSRWFELIGREACTRFTTAGLLIDSNVLSPHEKIGFVFS